MLLQVVAMSLCNIIGFHWIDSAETYLFCGPCLAVNHVFMGPLNFYAVFASSMFKYKVTTTLTNREGGWGGQVYKRIKYAAYVLSSA